MPFLRAIRRTPIAAPEGVHFSLNAVAGRSRLLHCIATRAGLEFLAGRHLTIEQLDRTFHVYRDRIEDAARCKSDAASAHNRVLTLTATDFGPNGQAAQQGAPSQWIAGRAPTLPLTAS
jgi:hypothetical protein